MKRRFAIASTLLFACSGVFAQANYPEKPIKLIVPYAPGGSADIAARLINDAWGKAAGGTMYIENNLNP